jgi:hypothetical protein
VLLLLFLDLTPDLGPVLALLGPALFLWGWGWWRGRVKQWRAQREALGRPSAAPGGTERHAPDRAPSHFADLTTLCCARPFIGLLLAADESWRAARRLSARRRN